MGKKRRAESDEQNTKKKQKTENNLSNTDVQLDNLEFVTDDLVPKTQERLFARPVLGLEEKTKPIKYFTPKEIEMLKQTDKLFKSSLIRLAFSEVLKEVGVAWNKQKSIETALRALKTVLDSMTSTKADCEDLFEFLPSEEFHELHEHMKKLSLNELEFKHPRDVTIVGSFLLRTVAKPVENVDVAIKIPKGYLARKDYGEFNYYVKRAAYLCAIAKHLQKTKMFENIKIQSFKGDKYKPILVIEPQKDEKFPEFSNTTFKIRIFPAIDESTFSLNAMYEYMNKNQKAYYIQGIMEDMHFENHLKLLHENLKDAPSLVEATILFKVWLRQRNMTERDTHINGFLMSMLLSYLINERKIAIEMSSYQIMKLVLQWIANTDISGGLSFGEKDKIPDEIKKKFDIVLMDNENRFNIFHRVSASAWQELKHEATLSLEYIDDHVRTEAVESLFLTKHNFWRKFDIHLKIQLSSVSKEKTNYNGDLCWQLFCIKRITEILQQALGTRLKALQVESHSDFIVVGLLLKRGWEYPLVKGPSPVEKEKKAEFDNFWGDLSKMRKFKDGSIIMGALFDSPKTHPYQLIEEISQYALHRHLNIQKEEISIIAPSLHTFLHIKNEDFTILNTKMNAAFERVKDSLSNINVNLILKEVLPVSAEFRKTAVYPAKINFQCTRAKLEKIPDSIKCNSIKITPLVVLLEYQEDRNWPDSIEAIAKLKELCYIKYHQQIKFPSICTPTWLDVLCDGFCFRIIIRLPKEFHILTTTGNALNPKVINMNKDQYMMPVHTHWITALSESNPAFQGTVRLAKRWTHAHMFSDYIDEVVVELLCAYVFLSPFPYQSPETSLVGFLRFIHLVANHDWKDTPLYVNFEIATNDQDKHKGYKEAMDKYNMLDKKPPIYIVASYNRDRGDFWTKGLTPMIVQRFVQYAKQTENVLNKLFSTLSTDGWLGIFKTSLSNFDLLIKLKEPNTKPFKTKSKQKKKLSSLDDLEIGFDPVGCYIQELRDRFSRFGLFFRDSQQGEYIGVGWNPAKFLPSEFQIAHNSIAMIPLSDGEMLPNIFEIVNDITTMGKGLISEVRIVEKSFKLPSLEK